MPLNEVELLLIKALSLKLIRGTLDEVDQNVRITWAIPHALDMDQITVMKDNLAAWQNKTETTMKFVEVSLLCCTLSPICHTSLTHSVQSAA